MTTPLEVAIYDNGKLDHRSSFDTAVEFGRQNVDEDAPYGHHMLDGVTRVIIAKLNEVTVPRRLLRGERVGDQARLNNLSKIPLYLDNGPALDPGAARDVPLPVTITVGDKAVVLQAPTSSIDGLQSLPESSYCPRTDPAASLLIATVARNQIAEGSKLDNEALLQWIQAALGILRSAAGNEDFFRRAARALVDLVGFDSGCVLLREKQGWIVHPQGRAGPAFAGERASEWQPSHQVLDSLQKQKKTFWQKLEGASSSESLYGVKSVVASPILDSAGEVTGALYGERRRGGAGLRSITRTEAMLVDLLAGGVAAGLARLEQEETRVLWEQFVTPDLARQLSENPDLLTGRDAEVTMLSCDIRGFSRICDNLGPARTLDWVQNVLGALSECVLAERGVVVDYVGDELLAMWGAPAAQPDHALRACRAALAMLAAVPVLNGRWKETTTEAMGLSIGINSGKARVGNIGSVKKFKYGALGTTVNLASRTQGATKFLKVPILITEAVRTRLDASFLTRRLCQVKVVNIPEVVTLCELAAPGAEDWGSLKESYEAALAQFEKSEYRLAARTLGRLLAEAAHRDDFPSQVLLQRAVTYMVEPPEKFDPVWKFDSKGK